MEPKLSFWMAQLPTFNRWWKMNLNKTVLTFLIIGCVAMGSFIVYLFLNREREPTYQGRTLSVWLKDYGVKYSASRDLKEALRHMGPKALPHILKLLKSRDSRQKLQLVQFANNIPFVKIVITSAEQKQRWGLWGLTFLEGDEAAWEALPALVPLTTNKNMSVRVHALLTLGFLSFRPGALEHRSELVPLLLQSLKDEHPNVRQQAVGALATAFDATTAIPAILPLLRDADPHVRAATAYALATFGTQAAEAIPLLIELANSEDVIVRVRASRALLKIDPTYSAPPPER